MIMFLSSEWVELEGDRRAHRTGLDRDLHLSQP